MVFSAGDFREISDLTCGYTDPGDKCQTVGPHRQVFIIHENTFKE
jgi:hypothetical protein